MSGVTWTRWAAAAAFWTTALLGLAPVAGAQAVSQRGFIEAEGVGFFEAAPNDPQRAVGDALLRQELFLDPTQWLRIAAGLDLRANSYHQVEDEWRLDLDDRTRLRYPRSLSWALHSSSFY